MSFNVLSLIYCQLTKTAEQPMVENGKAAGRLRTGKLLGDQGQSREDFWGQLGWRMDQE